MNYKGILLLLVFALSAVAAKADDLNQTQLSFRTNVYNFLSREGFNPQYDSDGDVKFKKSGNTYYVRVSSSDTDPLYVRISSYNDIPSQYTKATILLSLAEISFYKGIKGLLTKNFVVIQAELFINNFSDFAGTFYKLMSNIKSAEEEFSEDCEKFSNVGGSNGGDGYSSGVWPANPKIGRAVYGVSTFNTIINLGVPMSGTADSDIHEGYWYYATVKSNDAVIDKICCFRSYGAVMPDFLRQSGVEWGMTMSGLQSVGNRYGWTQRVKLDDSISYYNNRDYYILFSFDGGELSKVHILAK